MPLLLKMFMSSTFRSQGNCHIWQGFRTYSWKENLWVKRNLWAFVKEFLSRPKRHKWVLQTEKYLVFQEEEYEWVVECGDVVEYYCCPCQVASGLLFACFQQHAKLYNHLAVIVVVDLNSVLFFPITECRISPPIWRSFVSICSVLTSRSFMHVVLRDVQFVISQCNGVVLNAPSHAVVYSCTAESSYLITMTNRLSAPRK